MIVTIDGPAGAGKSSAARMLAQRLGFDFLDTGAMYRAVALAGLRAGCTWNDASALANLLDTLHLEMPPGRVLLNQQDVTVLIRSAEVTAASGAAASSPVVRERLVGWQRQLAAGRNIVCEGRDQGTIVFSDALCKFFLVADPEERARRRHRELLTRGESVSLEEISQAQAVRDSRDALRDIAPMVPAHDAIVLDSTHLTMDQVVERMEREVRRRITAEEAAETYGVGADPAAVPPSPPARTFLSKNDVPTAKPCSNDSLARMETLGFRVWHESLYLFSHLCLTLGFSLRTEGGRNLPPTGPALIVANHQSYFDPLLIGLVGRRPLVYLARRTLFRNPIFGAIIRSLNAVPIDQEGIGKDGMRVILEQLKLGKPVVVFPEGGRTPDGTMQPLKAGIHLLIRKTQAPIVPVGIAGAYDSWPIWRPCPIPAPLFWPAGKGTIAAVMGKPIDSRHYAEMPREQALQELFDRIHVEQQRAEELKRR